jgi:RNA polymerase sigma factor (sigma-70 family)
MNDDGRKLDFTNRSTSPALRRYTKSLVRGAFLPAESVDDILQDAWIKCCRYVDTKDSGAWEPLLKKTIRNLVVDQIRSRTAHPTTPITEVDQFAAAPAAENGLHYEWIAFRQDLLRTFSKREIQILDLHFEGYTHSEIAAKLEMSTTTLTRHRSRLVVKAQQYLLAKQKVR